MIKRLFIDEEVAELPETQAIRQKTGLAPEWVSGPEQVYKVVDTCGTDPVGTGKTTLYVTRNRGAFVKHCPGTRSYICCGYKILHIGTYCTMDCAYCILQAYFHPPVMQYFVNLPDLNTELDALFADNRIQRIGTGEFTDSLIWEHWTTGARRLVLRFAEQHHAVLELKTKTTAVEHLKHLDHRRKTIMAWSLNSPAVIQVNERGTATLEARLQAAARCQSWGYPLAFHFDPLVIYEGCEDDYRQVVTRLFECVDPDNVVWISLGTLRFMPELKAIIQQRFASSKLLFGEMITGLDGKIRYFKRVRIGLYRRMAEWIRAYAPDVSIYFCMEDEEVWQKSLGYRPREFGGLPDMLDRRAEMVCRLRRD